MTTSYNNRMYDKILNNFNRMQESYSPSTISDDVLKWIQESETQRIEGLDNFEYDALFDLASNVIQCIPPELLDETDVNMFISEFTEITSSITTYTISNGILWNVELMDKFLWIAMMLAVKITDKVIPYLSKLVVDKEYVLKHEDSNGNNCFTLACWNISCLIELLKVTSSSYLTNKTSNNVTSLDLLSYTGGIIQLLESKIISFEDVLSYVNTHYKTNVIHICSMNVDNITVLEYFVNSNKLTKEHMYAVDKNGNYPLMISCIHGSVKCIEYMLQSKQYDKDIINITNGGGNNILSYAMNNTDLLKYFMDFIDEEKFFDTKFYNNINNDSIFKIFVHSNLFAFNVLAKEYRILLNQDTNLLNWLFFKKTSFLDYVLNSDDEKIIEVMKQIFSIKKNFLAMSFHSNLKLPSLIIKSKYMSGDLLKEQYNNGTLLTKLINSLDDEDDRYNLSEVKELTNCIIDSPYTTIEIIDDNFINFCAKNFCELITKLVEKGFIENFFNVIYFLLNANNIKAVITLFENSYLNTSQLKGRVDLLTKLIKCDGNLLQMLINNDSLNDDIIGLLTIDGIININKLINHNFSITEDIWISLIKSKSLTKEKLNAFGPNGESILQNIESIKYLHLLLDNRLDFDHSLLFNNQCNFFVNKCVSGDIDTVKFLMKHPLFTKLEYDKFASIDASHILTPRNTPIVEEIIKHQYFDDKILNIKFHNGNNLLQHLICKKFNSNLVFYVINHAKITSEYFNYCNDNGNNCLMLALYAESYVSLIINSKYFKPDMMKIKNKNNVSAEDVNYDYLDHDFILTYLKLFPESDLLYRSFKDGNTIVHKLINENGIYILVELISIFDFKIMTTNNDNNDTPLHEITINDKYLHGLDLILELKHLNISKACFYQSNKCGLTPLINVLANINSDNTCILEKLIDLKIFTQSDMNTVLTEFIISINPYLLNVLDRHNFPISSLLMENDGNNEPLYFKFIKYTLNPILKHSLITIEALSLKNSLGNTLLFEIINTDQKLCMDLMNMKMINYQMLVPYLKTIVQQFPNTMKFLLNSIPELFTKENLLYCISQCIDINSDVLEMLLGSKYYNGEIFSEIYSKPELLNSLLSSTIGLKNMFENDLMTIEMLKKDNYKLMFNIDNPIYIKQMSDIIFSQENICDAIYDSKTIFHKCATYPGMIKHYIKKYIQNSQDNSCTVLLIKDKYKKTFMDYLIESKYVDDIIEIITLINKDTLLSLLSNQDNNGKNIIMKCCSEERLQVILDKIKLSITKEILYQQDHDNNLTIMYIARYTQNLFSELFKPDYNLVIHENIDSDDIFSITARYNYKNLQILLSHNELVAAYQKFDKCFVIACKYESYSINLLLNTGKINPKKCNGLIQYDGNIYYVNFLQVACRYNNESVKELINSKFNLQEFIDNIQYIKIDDKHTIAFNAFKIALLYEPNAISSLLESKYGCTKMITDTDILCKDNSCLVEIIEKQLSSFNRLTKSKYFHKCMYENQAHGNLLSKYSEAIPYSENSDRILKHKDIPCSENHKNICSTCYSNENRIVFAPCGHKCCIMCSTKVYQCPQCRCKINDRVIYN